MKQHDDVNICLIKLAKKLDPVSSHFKFEDIPEELDKIKITIDDSEMQVCNYLDALMNKIQFRGGGTICLDCAAA